MLFDCGSYFHITLTMTTFLSSPLVLDRSGWLLVVEEEPLAGCSCGVTGVCGGREANGAAVDTDRGDGEGFLTTGVGTGTLGFGWTGLVRMFLLGIGLGWVRVTLVPVVVVVVVVVLEGVVFIILRLLRM